MLSEQSRANIALANTLIECGIEVNKPDFYAMDEATQLKVTDDKLSEMLKFITDKYNSLDFSEIEKSGGDIRKFKYFRLLIDNCTVLENIYKTKSVDDEGAKKYADVISDIHKVIDFLTDKSDKISTLYKADNGVVQLIYTSSVAGVIYAIGTLISNTIRFVTTEIDTPCEVLYDEIPNTIKNIHIKNIHSVAGNLSSYNKVLDAFMDNLKNKNKKSMNEGIAPIVISATVLAIMSIILLLPRIIILIREIIYSIYYGRVKISDMLGAQADLIRVNIESLESGRGNTKIIARQKKIAEKLEKWKNRIAVNIDSAEVVKNVQIKKENKSLKIDSNTAFEASNPDDGLLL